MILLSRRSVLAIGAVVDIAQHAGPQPVSAKVLAARHDLPPRHLETVLQSLVRVGILKGIRGPRGGYELARDGPQMRESRLVIEVVSPVVREAGNRFLSQLDDVTVADLCREAESRSVF
jgi:Rrf2 family transcriptional regulator, iron-sulfur cluster assembly transcription factor